MANINRLGTSSSNLDELSSRIKDGMRAGMPPSMAANIMRESLQNSRVFRSPENMESFINYTVSNSETFSIQMDARAMVWPTPDTRSDLEDARRTITEQNEILERIQKEPLIVHTIDKISKDKKHTYYKKGDQEIRVEAPKDLQRGHDVLLHPKTFQIVENLGFPPLEASEFAPAKIPDITWEDIGGLEDAKKDIIEAIELPYREEKLFKHYKKRPIKGILLSGEPGCGKTMLAKAAANSIAKIHKAESVRTGFLYVKGPEILNMYVGATEQTIRNMFMDARRHLAEYGYPAIIFIDEADAILATRGNRSIGGLSTVVPAFLTEMDGLEESSAIVMLATNRPDALDPAIIREGRIDRKIHIPRPSKVNALTIVKNNLSKFPLAEGEDIDNLALTLVCEIFDDGRMVNDDTRLFEAINGAMLAACVDLAVSNAIHRDIGKEPTGVNIDDIRTAVERIHSQNKGLTHTMKEAA